MADTRASGTAKSMAVSFRRRPSQLHEHVKLGMDLGRCTSPSRPGRYRLGDASRAPHALPRAQSGADVGGRAVLRALARPIPRSHLRGSTRPTPDLASRRRGSTFLWPPFDSRSPWQRGRARHPPQASGATRPGGLWGCRQGALRPRPTPSPRGRAGTARRTPRARRSRPPRSAGSCSSCTRARGPSGARRRTP